MQNSVSAVAYTQFAEKHKKAKLSKRKYTKSLLACYKANKEFVASTELLETSRTNLLLAFDAIDNEDTFEGKSRAQMEAFTAADAMSVAAVKRDLAEEALKTAVDKVNLAKRAVQ
jgi:hypothetical protein